MKSSLFRKILIGAFFVVALFGAVARAASTGTIDPNNTGAYQAAFLDNTVVSDTAINFGKFTTESQYNITVSDSELRGYAWGSSVGYMVMNCADTTSGCSTTNGNFKVANNGSGLLSGYAWGENTGWINFGPFTDTSVSTVKIDPTTGNFEGTAGSAGYAWSQNYGWIVFDCTNTATCVNTSWRPTSTGGSTGGGTSGGGGVPTTPVTPTQPTGPTTPVTPTSPTSPTSPSNPTAPGQPGTGTTTFPSQPNQPPAGDNGSNPSEPTTPAPGDSTTQPSGNPTQSSTSNTPFSLPPAFTEAIGGMVSDFTTAASAVGSALANAASAIATLARTPAGAITNKVASAVGVVATAAAALAMLLFANPFALSEIFLLPFRLWTLFLVIFGFKKRTHPWGTVYDSVTKQPIDPAYVMLMDMQGNEVATSITDIDGRYGFSVAPGTYKIVANKTNFVFPSTKLANRQADELYNNLYFGDTIVVTEEGGIIAKNIPMDQLNFDWNEFAKTEQKRLSYFHKNDVLIARVSTFFFWLGFVISGVSVLSAHTIYNEIVFIIYILLFIVRHYSVQFKPKGSIKDAITGDITSFAILHVLSTVTGQEITHKVADRLGNYYCLVPNGQYNIVIDRKNPDASYTKIAIPEPVTVKKGYLKKDFTI